MQNIAVDDLEINLLLFLIYPAPMCRIFFCIRKPLAMPGVQKSLSDEKKTPFDIYLKQVSEPQQVNQKEVTNG